MQFIILGSGASAGVPQVGCSCNVCSSGHKYNQRLRSAALFTDNGGNTLLIDAGPDFRQQALRFGIKKVNAIYITHCHADHVDGLNEVRPYTFKNPDPIKLFIKESDLEEVKERFNFIFSPAKNYSGGPPPKFDIELIDHGKALNFFGQELMPFEVEHGISKVSGVKINQLAYIPDCNGMPEETEKLLQNIEHLVLDGFSPDKTIKHHYNIIEAIKQSQKLSAGKTYLTHLSHSVDYEQVTKDLPENVMLCYDGMAIPNLSPCS